MSSSFLFYFFEFFGFALNLSSCFRINISYCLFFFFLLTKGTTHTFHRSVSYYVKQVYAPDVLVVAISWTLFWMDKNVRPRVELLNIPQRRLESFYFHTNDVLLSIGIFKT